MDNVHGHIDDAKMVYLKSQPFDQDMVSGKYPPQRILMEAPDSVNILCKSADRKSGNNYDFTVDLLAGIPNIRKIKLSKIGMPLLPQINSKNKQISVTHTDGSFTVDLDEGFYNPQSLVNMMQAVLSAQWLLLGVGNTVTVSYDIDKRQLSIVDNLGEQFYIWTDCDFTRYARNVVLFPTQISGSALASSSAVSLRLGMIYSRYVIVQSDTLTRDNRSFSSVSNLGATNIVAVVSLTSKYLSDQFSPSASFAGTESLFETIDSPTLNFVNRNKTLKLLDLALTDEFGFSLEDLNTSTYKFDFGVFCVFECFM